MRLLLLNVFLLLFLYSKGQNNTITVVDYKSNETIPFAHICFEELITEAKYYLVTNKDGIVNIPGNKDLIVAVSFVGYKPLIDTIKPSRNYIFELYPKIFDIDQVVVIANFTPQKADQSIYNVKVIDAREIEMKAATNLSDIMSNVVNVKLNHDPALGTSLRLKGLSGNNVKILVDGVPIVGRVGGNIDLSQLNLYNIDHIEMVEGPLSVIYGSNALAGAINIITKENQYSKLTAKANAYYETVGTYNFDAGISSKKGKHSFALSGGRNFFSGFMEKDYIIIDNNNTIDNISYPWKPKEQYNADFYYTLTGGNNKLKFQSSYMRERLQSKGSLQPPQYYTAFDDWFYSTRFTNRLEFTQKLKSSLTLNMLGSHSYYLRRNATYFKDLEQLSSVLTDEDTTQFNAFIYRLLLGNNNPEKKLSFISGVDLNYEIATGERILNDKKEIADFALFTSLMYKLTDNISIQPGLRFAYNSQFDVPPVPSVNLKWDIISQLTMRLSYARGYRAPTLKELYIFFVDINHNIQPNENIKAEYGHNFDFALRFNTDKEKKIHYSNFELGLFYNNMNNIIYLARRQVEDIKDPIYQYINILDYNTLGGQISFQYNFYPYMDFGLSIGETGTYSSFDKRKPSLNDYKFSPDLNANISSHIQKVKMTFSLSYKYTGKSYLYDVDESDQINITTLDDYHNMDFTIVKKLFMNRLTVSAGVKNIFNNTNIDVVGGGTGTAHTSGNSSPVGYGRVYFTRLAYNIFK
ncbi:TonB-dependent receptor domain-containing protein [Bacteroidota bacterium]